MYKISSPLVQVAAIRKNHTLQVFENKVQSLFYDNGMDSTVINKCYPDIFQSLGRCHAVPTVN
jgi:hypothetical protein